MTHDMKDADRGNKHTEACVSVSESERNDESDDATMS